MQEGKPYNGFILSIIGSGYLFCQWTRNISIGGIALEEYRKRTWAEVSLENLRQNYRALRELLPSTCRFMGMVKSNAYGHGAVRVAQELQHMGADYLGVACLDEAMELREGGITMPILILGGTAPEDVEKLLKYKLAQTVYDSQEAKALSEGALAAGGVLTVHIKIDTGMSRLGFYCDENTVEPLTKEILEVCGLEGLQPEGIFTHFADSDSDEAFTLLQFTRFWSLLEQLEERGQTFSLRHTANSGATIRYPFSHLDMVRPGLALYGYYPGSGVEEICDLRPALELKSRLISIKPLPAGSSLSYGRTVVLEEERQVAVVPIGYGDGFSRGLSNRFSVEVKGQRAPILGRICMDMCLVDVTGIPQAKLWDETIIYGADSKCMQSVEGAAALMDTIPYEVLCGLSRRIPRLYKEEKGGV